MTKRRDIMNDVETVKFVIHGIEDMEAGDLERVVSNVAKQFGVEFSEDKLGYSDNQAAFEMKLKGRDRQLFAGLFNFESGAFAENLAQNAGYKPLGTQIQKGVKTIALAPDVPEDRRIILMGTDKLMGRDKFDTKELEQRIERLGIENRRISFGNDEVYIDFKARMADIPAIKEKMLDMGILARLAEVPSGINGDTKAYVRDAQGRTKQVHTLVGRLT